MALYDAALQDDSAKISALLDQGTSVDCRSGGPDRNLTPLMGAAYNGHYNAVKLLLARGADANLEVVRGNGTTALTYAQTGNRQEVVRLLTGNPRPGRLSELRSAAANGDVQRCKELLAGGIPVDSADEKGGTPLIYAANRNRVEEITFLVANGAQVNRQDADGKTAIVYAILEGNLEAVKILISLKADVNIVDNHNGRPLMAAEFMSARDKGRNQLFGEITDLLKAAGAHE